jgi:DNA-binding response OmpR family regulator
MKKKILITEDDPGLQELFRMILEKAGYEVMVQANGDAIIKNQFMLPDLFLLDKQLAGMDGTDICRFLKGQQKTKNIPVVMISANPGIREISRQAGADGYIEKPFAKNHFLKTIEEKIRSEFV